MLKVLSYILCDLDPKVKVIGQKAGICDSIPSTSVLVRFENGQFFSFLKISFHGDTFVARQHNTDGIFHFSP